MKRFFAILSLLLLCLTPLVSNAQPNGVGGRIVTVGSNQSSSVIPGVIVTQVLTLAAPSFGFAPLEMIRMYYSCNCITITQIGPGVYFVEYGGIGIQIVIDGCRVGLPPAIQLGVGANKP